MIAIIDYRAGNLTSVARALRHENIDCVITADKHTLQSAHGLIFPGVGAAKTAMHNLQDLGLISIIKELVAARKPLLGICLGCQIILDSSEEHGKTETLGIFSGMCRRFNPAWRDENGQPISIPHMGWNTVSPRTDCILFTGISPNAQFYFVHGFYPNPAPEYILGTTVHGKKFCSVLGRKGLWAVQFHPEKSGKNGLRLLKNFADFCLEKKNAE